jgi:hypothetical protein
VTSVPFFLIFFVVAVAYAAWRGGGPERATAAVFVLALAGSAEVGFLHVPGNFRVVPLALFLVDSLLLIALCVIAVRANRWWTIPVAGCQLVEVLVHACKLLDAEMIPDSYALLVTIWSWPMVALLALGTWEHTRRLARGIIAPDWKASSAQHPSPIHGRQQPS